MQVDLLTPAHEIDHLLHVRLEGIVTDEAPVEKAFDPDGRPVEVVRDRLLPCELEA